MKLANLVNTKNKIQELNHDEFILEYENYANSLLDIIGLCEIEQVEYIDKINQRLSKLKNIVSETELILNELKQKINQEIAEKTKDWSKAGYVTENGYTFTTALIAELEQLNRVSIPADSTKQKVLSNIQKYTQPKFACLEIGPGDGVWTPHLVAADPLYLIDIQQEFLDSTLFKFPEQYRRRVRPYLADFDDPYNLDVMPQNQFGFIFSWNVFDYFPKIEMKQYLESCYKVLRPGGVMLFSYNNCDTVAGVNYAENGSKSWMTEELVSTLCTELGFEIQESTVELDSWVVIKKPGELKTVKTHQALGEIINQNR